MPLSIHWFCPNHSRTRLPVRGGTQQSLLPPLPIAGSAGDIDLPFFNLLLLLEHHLLFLFRIYCLQFLVTHPGLVEFVIIILLALYLTPNSESRWLSNVSAFTGVGCWSSQLRPSLYQPAKESLGCPSNQAIARLFCSCRNGLAIYSQRLHLLTKPQRLLPAITPPRRV